MVDLQRVGHKSGKTLEQRFWSKVTVGSPLECWTWKAGKNACGYGTIGDGNTPARSILAHRLSWIIAHGKVPDGLCVLHHCDNPPCCNPAHLYVGTMKDNCIDRDKRGRHGNIKGERHGRARLNWEKVAEIRKLWPKMTMQQIAAKFGVTPGTIWFVVKLKTWTSAS